MPIQPLLTFISARWRTLRATKDSGYSTETVVVTAVLVAAALIVLGIIIAKVMAKAESIDME